MLSLLLDARLRLGALLRFVRGTHLAWQRFGSWMLKNKLIKKPIAPPTIATNAYLSGC